MRTIKFKAKCLLLERWMYGSLYIKKSGKVYINSTEVDSETVCQFTGRYYEDEYGDEEVKIELYELDRVIFLAGTEAKEGNIIWEEDKTGFIIATDNYDIYEFDDVMILNVDGNWHDNPELLK